MSRSVFSKAMLRHKDRAKEKEKENKLGLARIKPINISQLTQESKVAAVANIKLIKIKGIKWKMFFRFIMHLRFLELVQWQQV